ncbi:MAG: DivIVA domain-containing protein [Propionibacteriaceae bacterium]
MTLTLDEVRKTRFHMSRRQGYEVSDVDNFVDKVEATIQAMTEENETLKKQATDKPAVAPAAAAPVVDTRLQDENKHLTEEIKRLNEELAEARRDAGAPQQLQDSLKRCTEEIERLRVENKQLHTQLEEKQETATAATAATAATPVVENGVQKIVVSTAADASPQVTRMVELAIKQSEQVVSEAEAEAKRKVDDANRQAHEITVDARTKAERVESEARINAEKMTSDAQSRANALDGETKNRRAELFTALEQERDLLHGKVGELREFEGTYRTNIQKYLSSQIDALKKGVFEPENKPGLLAEAPGNTKNDSSTTPRLDALLVD